MKVQKYSRQREAIKAFLKDNHAHPTADEVYTALRQTFPNVSLGTVYRNLHLLAECGEIRQLSFPAGPDHFDCTLKPHYHFVCRKCGKVYDMPSHFTEEVEAEAAREAPGVIDSHDLVFYGTCNECLHRLLAEEGKQPVQPSERKTV